MQPLKLSRTNFSDCWDTFQTCFICSILILFKLLADSERKRLSRHRFICSTFTTCGALRDLVPFVQFQKREKHPWRSVTKSNTPPWVFFTFFKLYEWYQIAQSTTYSPSLFFIKLHYLSRNVQNCSDQSSLSIPTDNIKKGFLFYLGVKK